MTYAPEPVASGQPVAVLEVEGRPPRSLNDFIGDVDITVDERHHPMRMVGVGMHHDDGVRFHQKDDGPDGKDIRVWMIRGDSGRGWWAEPMSAF